MKLEDNCIVLANDEAAYSRRFAAWIEEHTCSVCDAEAVCLRTDGSDGEYGGPSFCSSCLDKINDHIKTQKP